MIRGWLQVPFWTQKVNKVNQQEKCEKCHIPPFGSHIYFEPEKINNSFKF